MSIGSFRVIYPGNVSCPTNRYPAMRLGNKLAYPIAYCFGFYPECPGETSSCQCILEDGNPRFRLVVAEISLPTNATASL